MPIYEYRCDRCGQHTEMLQKMSDPPLSACPHCGGTVAKMIAASALQFKGSGFYINDYARKGKGEGDAGEAKAKPDTGEKKPDAGENKADGGGKKAETGESSKPPAAKSSEPSGEKKT